MNIQHTPSGSWIPIPGTISAKCDGLTTTEMKTTTQHTPGPWHNIPDQPTIWDASQDTMIAKVTELPWIDGKSQWQIENANARLIAAAPELLAALEDAEFLLRKLAANWKEAVQMADSCQRSATDARAVIAKVKGQA